MTAALALLDCLAIDEAGRPYDAANGAGQDLARPSLTAICAIARGLRLPERCIGRGVATARSQRPIAVTFAGEGIVITGAIPTAQPGPIS